MTSRQIGQKLHREQHVSMRFLAGVVIVVLIALGLAWAFTRPVTAPTVQSVEQPAIGQSMVVTGLRYDGTAYRSAPIAVSAELQPAIGQSMVVTGLKYDGISYRNADIRVAAPTYPRSYTVNALVYDEVLGYHTAPVVIGGR